jgi:hypothetical protein
MQGRVRHLEQALKAAGRVLLRQRPQLTNERRCKRLDRSERWPCVLGDFHIKGLAAGRGLSQPWPVK